MAGKPRKSEASQRGLGVTPARPSKSHARPTNESAGMSEAGTAGLQARGPHAQVVEGVEIYSGSELDAFRLQPPAQPIERLIAPGVTILGGKPKVGKSLLALDLALAVATGR